VDETTHAFADKVYDRAQLIELEAPRDLLQQHMGGAEYRDLVMQVWDAIHDVTPFAFRILDDIAVYVREADKLDVGWQDAVDEQLVQKILPKLNGADLRVGAALKRFIEIAADRLPLSYAKAVTMHEGFIQHGFASYF
jgi:hypothetical protein